MQLHKGDGEGARRTLDRALQSLPRRKHIKARCQLAPRQFRLTAHAGSLRSGASHDPFLS